MAISLSFRVIIFARMGVVGVETLLDYNLLVICESLHQYRFYMDMPQNMHIVCMDAYNVVKVQHKSICETTMST